MTASLMRDRAFAFAATLLVALVLSSCADGGGGNGAQPTPPATIVFARGADSIKLDPADITDGESVKVCTNIYEGLLEYEASSTQVRPCLADAYEVSEDGLVYTFDLRSGVRFHDGTPCNAAAVVDSFQRQADPGHRFAFGLPYIYWNDMFAPVIDSIEAVNDAVVRITLKTRHTPFLSNLAMFPVMIVSPTALAEHGEGIASHPVGTGPYEFMHWHPGEEIVLERNDDYWREPAATPRVRFLVVPDKDNRMLRTLAGEFTFMDAPATEHFEKLAASPKIELLRQPGMNVAYLALNHRSPAFSDVRVRRAVCHALRKDVIAADGYTGHATPATNPLPPTLWGYADELADYPHDVARAKELLAEAGYDSEQELNLFVMSNPRQYMPDPPRLAQLIQQDLSKVGVRVRIHPSTWEAHLKATHNAEHDMALLGWMGDNGDPDNFLYVLCDRENARLGSASNISFYESDALHEVLVAAQSEPSQDRRAELYVQAQQIIHDDVGIVPLVHTEDTVVMLRGVKGFEHHPTGTMRLRRVELPRGTER